VRQVKVHVIPDPEVPTGAPGSGVGRAPCRLTLSARAPEQRSQARPVSHMRPLLRERHRHAEGATARLLRPAWLSGLCLRLLFTMAVPRRSR
jgi:hypothetical protein